MDGATRRAGAVAALRDIRNAIRCVSVCGGGGGVLGQPRWGAPCSPGALGAVRARPSLQCSSASGKPSCFIFIIYIHQIVLHSRAPSLPPARPLVSVARAVRDRSDHTLLAGDLASNFAFQMGFFGKVRAYSLLLISRGPSGGRVKAFFS